MAIQIVEGQDFADSSIFYFAFICCNFQTYHYCRYYCYDLINVEYENSVIAVIVVTEYVDLNFGINDIVTFI